MPFLTLYFVCLLTLLYVDAKVKESPRAVNDIASAPVSPYSFASGSADGCIRLWDWRERKGPVYIVAHQHASVRSLAVGPFVDTQLNIVAGLDSGMLFRYDLRVSYPAADHGLVLTRPSIVSNI
jgi:WD40 repeat protein